MEDGDQKKNHNDNMTALFLKDMKPRPASIELNKTALIIIDMQIDFLEPGGFGELLGNDVSKLQRAIVPTKNLLDAARKAGMFIIHTREGHRPCESDLHRRKRIRLGADENESDKDNNDNNKNSNTHNIGVIGSPGPNGRILIRGEPGHDIIESLRPKTTTAGGAMIEPIIDKPGKGSFYGTDLECILRARGIETLLVCGVTTEVCVHTTVREANDRGYACIVISDACASYFDDFHKVALEMIVAQGGIFGSVTDSKTVIEALKTDK